MLAFWEEDVSDRKKPTTAPPASEVSPPRIDVAPGEPELAQHPIGTPRGLVATGGVLAVAAWLSERGIFAPPNRPWGIQIALGTALHVPPPVFAETVDTRLQIMITANEWSYYFAHQGRASRVRITDLPHADGRDDYQLAPITPPLRQLSRLVRELEQRFKLFFRRHHAAIDTTLAGTEPSIRAWLTTL